MIFKEVLTVKHYDFDFCLVCNSRRKGLSLMCHIEVFRILQGGGSKDIIPGDSTKMVFIFLQEVFPP